MYKTNTIIHTCNIILCGVNYNESIKYTHNIYIYIYIYIMKIINYVNLTVIYVNARYLIFLPNN